MGVAHFLTLMEMTPADLNGIIKRSIELKARQRTGGNPELLKNRMLGMIFEKSSTRTRASFETGMLQLGGGSMFLSPRDTQLGRGETVEDAARVLSRMVDVIAVRTFKHEKLETFARNSRVPVINALTDLCHPCQLLADIQTFYEHRGEIAGKTVAWVGDGNNMCHSYINAARQWEFNLRIACPAGYDPDKDIFAAAGTRVTLSREPKEVVRGAHLVVTDVWASMGQEEEQDQRAQVFSPYQVNAELMALAQPDALFMHCLPAHRGEEVTNEVLEGDRSVVWDEAENRLHAQKALLEFLLP